MFTGIIKHLGTVAEVAMRSDSAGIAIAMPAQLRESLAIGDSVAVNGCCLTVTAIQGDAVARFDLGSETLQRTAPLAAGQQVHLEPSLRAGDQLGGHLVSGHVDGLTTLLDWQQGQGDARASFSLPDKLDPRLVVPQGSVAIAGVSLTVAGVDADIFTVQLIPQTMAATLLNRDAALHDGARCNFEADYLARYAIGRRPAVLE